MTCATQCAAGSAERLQAMNAHCACMPIDTVRVQSTLARNSTALTTAFAQRPVLFAATPVFMCAADIDYINQLVSAIEQTLQTARFTELLQNRSTEFKTPASPGMFTAYDFHIALDGPKLIEINTNAGGAFLLQDLYAINASDVPLCGGHWGAPSDPEWIHQMLVQEWRSSGQPGIPNTLAIVDDAPHAQFLEPDFVLAQRYFRVHGIEVLIVDPDECSLQHGRLRVGSKTIDMVYNRLTDFYFAEPRHRTLRDAWLGDAALFSPTPDHHAMYADKRNLVWLSDAEREMPWASNPLLNSIPRVQSVI